MHADPLPPPPHLSTATSLSSCAILTLVFFGSFYLLPNPNNLPRDDPRVIKQRFKAVAGSCVFGALFVGVAEWGAGGFDGKVQLSFL